MEWGVGVALLRLLLRGASSKDGVEEGGGGGWKVGEKRGFATHTQL